MRSVDDADILVYLGEPLAPLGRVVQSPNGQSKIFETPLLGGQRLILLVGDNFVVVSHESVVVRDTEMVPGVALRLVNRQNHTALWYELTEAWQGLDSP